MLCFSLCKERADRAHAGQTNAGFVVLRREMSAALRPNPDRSRELSGLEVSQGLRLNRLTWSSSLAIKRSLIVGVTFWAGTASEVSAGDCQSHC